MYEYNTRVGFSACGADKKINITSMLDLLQDCSTFQTEDLGVGFDRLEPEGLVWVVNYWELEIIRRPNHGETVTVGTFPYDFKGCFGFRNFYIKDEQGEYLLKANTLWTLISVKNNMMAKAPEDIVKAYVLEPKLDMEYGSRKVTFPDEADCFDTEPIFITSMYLDGNGHVNNAQYLKMAFSVMEEADCVIDQISHIRIDYRKQAMKGDIIKPVVFKTEDSCIIALCDEECKPYSVAEIK